MEYDVNLLEGERRETTYSTQPGEKPNTFVTTKTVVDTHTVSPGETLSEITYDKTGDGTYDSYMEIANHNNMENPDLIFPGDEIKFPVHEEIIETKLNIPDKAGLGGPIPSSSAPKSSPSSAPSGGASSSAGGLSSGGGGVLSIEQATIGYDKMGLQQVVNRLNLIVFNGAAVVVRNSIVPVHMAVDACWRGQAADSFKAKFERDAHTMVDTLNRLEEEVRGQIAQMAQNVDNYDAAIAEKINSME